MTHDEYIDVKYALLMQLNDLLTEFDKKHEIKRTDLSRNFAKSHIHDLWSEMIFEISPKD